MKLRTFSPKCLSPLFNNYVSPQKLALLFIFTFLFVQFTVQAVPYKSTPTLYLIAAVDTSDEDIYGKQHLEQLDEWINFVRDTLRISVEPIIMTGKDFHPNTIMTKIEELDAASLHEQDALMYIHIGHGKDGVLGDVKLLFGGEEKLTFQSKKIESKILETSFRTKVTVFDACHNNPKRKLGPQNKELFPDIESLREDAAEFNFRKLFFLSEGAITFFSSSPKQAAWANQDMGPIFSYYFLSNLEEFIRDGTTPDWKLIAQEAQKDTRTYTRRNQSITKAVQKPYYWGIIDGKQIKDKRPPAGHVFNKMLELPTMVDLSPAEQRKVKDDKDIFRKFGENIVGEHEELLASLSENRGTSHLFGRSVKSFEDRWKYLLFTKKMEDYLTYHDEGSRKFGTSVNKVSYQDYVNSWTTNGKKAIFQIDSITYDAVPTKKLLKNIISKVKVVQYIYHVYVYRTVEYYTDDTVQKERLRVDYTLVFNDFKIKKIRKTEKNPADHLRDDPHIIGISVTSLGGEASAPALAGTGNVGGTSNPRPSRTRKPKPVKPVFSARQEALAMLEDKGIEAVEDFSMYLETIYGNRGISSMQGQEDLRLVESTFRGNTMMQVSSLNRRGYTSFDLAEYLNRMRNMVYDPNSKKYDRVVIDIEGVELSPDFEFKEISTKDGSRVWKGVVRYYQTFAGYKGRRSKPAYADYTSKDTEVYVIRTEDSYGDPSWSILLGNITVHSTLPINN